MRPYHRPFASMLRRDPDVADPLAMRDPDLHLRPSIGASYLARTLSILPPLSLPLSVSFAGPRFQLHRWLATKVAIVRYYRSPSPSHSVCLSALLADTR